jgi:hypothetical protein
MCPNGDTQTGGTGNTSVDTSGDELGGEQL